MSAASTVAKSVLAVSLVPISLAAVVWFGLLPHYRPHLKPGERYGIDVSHHQGEIDWGRVARDDVSFAYIKATEGGDFIDERFGENWIGAERAGLDRGACHFFTLCRSGDVQASHFLRTLPEDPGELVPAVDLELAGNCADRPDRGTVLREINEFLTLVERDTARRMLLYLAEDFESLYAVRDVLDRGLWHLQFLRRPHVEGWVVWQVMGFAHIEGIRGDVDLNVMRDLG
jgi:lysozyme